jgi:outer membrane protein assembly factor BamB
MTERSLNRRVLLGGAAAAAVAAGAVKFTPSFAQDATPEPELHPEASPVAASDLPTVPPEFATETNWPVEGGNLKATRLAAGSSISTSTVGDLGLAWTLPIEASGSFGALVANPVIVDGVIYQQSGVSDVYAIDLATGEIKWQKTYNQQVPTGGPNGVAVAYGNAYYAVGGEGEVVAVNAETGEDIWSIFIAGPRKEGIDMAPAVYGGVVYISTIPGNVDAFYQGGQRGVIHGLDATTGQVLWYFDTVVDNLWGNALVNSGGGLWHPPAFDDDGFSYYGIGNASPYPGTEEFPNASSRPGDNDYTNNVLKIDPATVGLVWNHNLNPHDVFDLDTQLTPVLTSWVNEETGYETKLVIGSGKHGFVVAMDPLVGEEVWRTPVGKHQNELLDEVPEGETIEVYPGTLGGVETPFAVADGRVLVPVLNLATWYTGAALDATKLDFTAGTGEVVALDVKDGSVLWDVEVPTGMYGGATVANDVVFVGGLDGVVRGYNTADGTLVWSYQTAAGINTSFAISGDYLVVPSGGLFAPSSDTASPAPELAPALYVFKIGASSEATPTA